MKYWFTRLSLLILTLVLGATLGFGSGMYILDQLPFSRAHAGLFLSTSIIICMISAPYMLGMWATISVAYVFFCGFFIALGILSAFNVLYALIAAMIAAAVAFKLALAR